MLPPLLLESRALRRAKPISQVAGFCCQNLSSLPMAGLEPARAFYGPTDFKSVASTISPHRRCAAHLKLVMQSAKTNFALADLHLEQPKAFRCARHEKLTAFAEVESAMRAYSELI